MKINKIAVITSGGDCQGMNACLYNIVKMATANDIKVIGYYEGFRGILEKRFSELTLETVDNIFHIGGTIIKTSRCPEFLHEDAPAQAAKNLKKEKVDALIVIGGDGSFKGTANLIKQGVKCIAIPATIDNDLFYTQKSIGFDSAVNNAVVAIDSIKQSFSSLNRCGIIEVMGRTCGDIALFSAVATNSDAIIINEKPTSQKDIVTKVKDAIKRGIKNPIVIVAENILDIEKLAKSIETSTKKEVRTSVLGYIQRGGAPSVNDRILAMQMGVRAVELITKGLYNRAIGIKNEEIFEITIEKSLNASSNFNYKLLDLFYKLN